MVLSCLSEKTLKNHDQMELSWANNVYNTEFSVENRLEHGFAIENTYFLWKWRFAHYFHYYSVLSVFRPHIVQNRKLTLFSWGNFDQTTRISAKVRYKQVFSMKLSYFLEIFSTNDRIWVFVHCNGPKLPKWENTEKSRSDGAFMGKQCL